jgi:hypothetical protein
MRIDTASRARVEASVLYVFSPSGVAATLIMILLGCLLFGGNGIERRMNDRSMGENHAQIVSPLLATHR